MHLFFVLIFVGNACNFSCLLLCTSEECLRLKPEHTSRQAWSHQCPQGIETWLWLGHKRVQTPTSTPLCALLGHQHSGLAYRALGNSTHFPVTATNASTKTLCQIILCYHLPIFLLFSVRDKRTASKAGYNT